ncbi:hypothetical protein M1M24_gp17 [Polaribacter phage Freya_1]|uniref:Uncharacterized protein n=1 Tax=Polaribacter phage Freya_1 TaxID=2745662 RepID=A0A8E4ZJI2_9CAUD|nr:hypothetical protein M1M24_gp17 [Polaribacter phage Freya_1]QQV90954.1 hypothetical protein Freya2_17 [Polaribacter phage Freya_2]QQV91022.1 hypothetical protein Freya3_17 [Polaribacter phage Freya_3]QQV91090.1 hypothetical protein Freya4_17 [Polaribacter phage Freya_4]QQV91165.1 hypothetical protein Freya8_24 [Polaribacter phage Freya_8]QQV91242.1 hypothetical protein Freya9_26 [Polaribacter phage Freya_9]QQV91320.1 hypothetical protein Freya10_27 [Polaribacter phage Freya_10]QYV99899.1 
MKLVIKGDANKVERLEKELRLRLKRDGLNASLIKGKGKEKPEIKTTTDDDKKPHWKEVVAAIGAAETLEDLEQFKSDDRASVIKALAEKELELEAI